MCMNIDALIDHFFFNMFPSRKADYSFHHHFEYLTTLLTKQLCLFAGKMYFVAALEASAAVS